MLALFEIPPKTHDPAKHLANLTASENLPKAIADKISELLPDIISYGFNEHIMTDYGDEASYTLPWDIFTKESASDALKSAQKCIQGAKEIAELKKKADQEKKEQNSKD